MKSIRTNPARRNEMHLWVNIIIITFRARFFLYQSDHILPFLTACSRNFSNDFVIFSRFTICEHSSYCTGVTP